MTATIKLKKSSVSSNAPGTSDIDYGELAINYADGNLYYKNSSNVIKNFADSDNVQSSINAAITAAGSYNNASVDTHLNQSTAGSGEVLSWNGSDYDWVSAADSTKLPLAGGTMSGDIDGNGNKVLFANVYSATGDLPSASTYHGMFAHVHGTGKGYFAHAGNWVALANDADLTSTTSTANAALPKAGGTMTGDILYSDGIKAKFGADSDLEIYHDGTNSYIHDNGTGALKIRSDSLRLENSSGIRWFQGSGNFVTLMAAGGGRLSTTSAGIDVTGNIAITGTVDGVDIATNIPASLGTAGQVLTVNAGASAGEWADAGSGGATSINGLSDALVVQSNSSIGIGTNALNSSVATNNIGIGLRAGCGITSGGANNLAIGTDAMCNTTGGDYNVALGDMAMKGAGGVASYNTFVGGYGAGKCMEADFNVGVGFQVMSGVRSGTENVAVGAYSLKGATNACPQYSTAIGYRALCSVTTGVCNTAVGHCVLKANTFGVCNVAIGNKAMAANTTGKWNTAVGACALATATTAHSNIAMGTSAASRLTTGLCNTALGYAALTFHTINGANTAVGYNAMKSSTTSVGNTAVGSQALCANQGGRRNTVIGCMAGSSINGGHCNIIIAIGGYNLCQS